MTGLLPPLGTTRRERATFMVAVVLAVVVFLALVVGAGEKDPTAQEWFTYEGQSVRCTVIAVDTPTGDRELHCPGLVERLDPTGNERLTLYTTGADRDRVRLWSGRYNRAWEPVRA